MIFSTSQARYCARNSKGFGPISNFFFLLVKPKKKGSDKLFTWSSGSTTTIIIISKRGKNYCFKTSNPTLHCSIVFRYIFPLHCYFYWISINNPISISINMTVIRIWRQVHCYFYWISINNPISISINLTAIRIQRQGQSLYQPQKDL